MFVSANSLDPTSRHLSRFALLRCRVARLNNQRLSADSHPAPTGCGVFFALKRIEDKPAGWLSAAKKERKKLEPCVTLESTWIICFRILDCIHLVQSTKKLFLKVEPGVDWTDLLSLLKQARLTTQSLQLEGSY